VGGSLTPPAALVGGTARQVARHEGPTPGPDVDGLGGSSFSFSDISVVCIDWVGLIDWFGEGR